MGFANLPPPDGASAPGSLTGNAAERLRRGKEQVLARWVERVRREIFAARHESYPILIDTLPLLYDQLVEALDPNSPRLTAPQGSTACQEHGGERARVTHYSIEGVIQEYQILRDIVFETLESSGPITAEERDIVWSSIDGVMKQAAISFGLVQNRIREQFVMTLSHDLRGPLTAARANAELILRYPDRTDQHIRLAGKVVHNLARIDKMITALLDANRVQSGERLALHPAPCDLHRVAETVIEELELVHNRVIRLEGRSAQGVWDEDGMTRIIENLCVNAIKYGDPDNPITLSIQQEHGRTCIRVHNHGNAIPTEEQETLFQAYRRAHSTRGGQTKGWGLGLALVRGVAEAHGGSVMVDSAPERGTTFIVDVPTDCNETLHRAKQPFS